MALSKSALYTVVNILNTLSLAASITLLVAITAEVTDIERSQLSEWYRAIQLIVCSLFFVTALSRLIFVRIRFTDIIFAIASIPYIDILRWSGHSLTHTQERLAAFVPVMVSIIATAIILEWLIEGRRQRLMAAYILTVTMFTYICALLFYDCEQGVNSSLKGFGDALWWACMNLTTVGAEIFPVTTAGKIICVVLPIIGMMFFPIFTVYISGYYDKKREVN